MREGQDLPARFQFVALGGGPLALEFAHRTYTLTISDLLAPGGSLLAKAQSWRYVAVGPAGPQVAEVFEAQLTGEHRFSQISQGTLPALADRTLRWLHDDADLGGDSYEVRALRIPELLVDAIWLKDLVRDSGDRYAVLRAIAALIPRRLYGGDEFFGVLRGIARARIPFDNSPRIGG